MGDNRIGMDQTVNEASLTAATIIARDPALWAARWIVQSIEYQLNRPSPLPRGYRRIA